MADPIGVFVGGNPGTGGILPEGMSFLRAAWDALFAENTACVEAAAAKKGY